MQINIKSRNGKLTEQERDYLEQKLQKLQRYGEGINAVTVELTRRQERNAGEMHTVQATLQGDHGVVIRAEERDSDFNTVIDSVHDRLQRQLTRYKDRHYRRGHVRGEQPIDQPIVATVAQSSNGNGNGNGTAQLVRTKQFQYKPMHAEEAIERMELLSHDFFIFTNADTDHVNVVYRRRDGNYGVIEPDPDQDGDE